ncbi:hypothetical protein R5R35_002464 [Gryllus longicercus]|uniref:Uncharacterized protein n=1 Tax=Gryllus longicercus TaxID=2509291 RepID=A0AAN9V7S9_9ORTH
MRYSVQESSIASKRMCCNPSEDKSWRKKHWEYFTENGSLRGTSVLFDNTANPAAVNPTYFDAVIPCTTMMPSR